MAAELKEEKKKDNVYQDFNVKILDDDTTLYIKPVQDCGNGTKRTIYITDKSIFLQTFWIELQQSKIDNIYVYGQIPKYNLKALWTDKDATTKEIDHVKEQINKLSAN